MDILHVTQPTTAGVKRVVLDLVTDQSQRGFDVAVACPADDGMLAALAEIGVRHVTWKASRSPGPSVAGETMALRRIVGGIRPRVLHLHSSKAGLAGRLAFRGRLPTVFQPHGWSFLAVNGPLRRATLVWERLAGRWANVTICVSQAEGDLGREMGIQSNFETVQNGIDLTVWQAPDANSRRRVRLALKLNAEAPIVVCVGRMQRQKGQDLLLEAWKGVVTQHPQAQLILVGDGPDRVSLEAQAGKQVSFVGERSDVRDWVLASDVIVMPSRWEGLSIALLESMACRRAIVATDVTGMREAAGNGAAVLIPPENIAELRAAIIRLLDSPQERAALGDRARARVERDFDVANTCRHVLEVYSQISGHDFLGRQTEHGGIKSVVSQEVAG